MGEARLSWARHRAAADDGSRRSTVMGRSERRREDDGAPQGQSSSDRVDPRHLESLLAGERWQDPRKAPPEHRFTRPRRACQQHVVLPRRCQLERPSPTLLTSNLGEVGQERLLEFLASRRARKRYLLLAAEVGHGLREMADRDDVYAGESCLGRRLGRAEQERQTSPPGPFGNGNRAGYGANPTVERELTDARMLDEAGR